MARIGARKESYSYQKLLGLYLLATMMMASFESSSIGYTPYAALGKCSLTYVPKLFNVDLLFHNQQAADPESNHCSSHLHKVDVFALQNVALCTARLLRGMVECEARGTLDVVVTSVAKGIVRADNHRTAAAR